MIFRSEFRRRLERLHEALVKSSKKKFYFKKVYYIKCKHGDLIPVLKQDVVPGSQVSIKDSE